MSKYTEDLMWGYLSYDNPMSVNYNGGKLAKKTEKCKKEKVENKAKDDRKTASEKRREKIMELKRSREELEKLKKDDTKSKRIR